MPAMHLGVFVPFLISRATLGYLRLLPKIRWELIAPCEPVCDESCHYREASFDHAIRAIIGGGRADGKRSAVHNAAADSPGEPHHALSPDRGCRVPHAVDDYAPTRLREFHSRGRPMPRDAPVVIAAGGSTEIKPRTTPRYPEFVPIPCPPKNPPIPRQPIRCVDRCR
jgi:hypothetical protein